MLVYVGFIFLIFAGSVLGGNKPKCNKPEHTCPKNEHYTRNNPRCIKTCANKWVPTSDDCKPFTGCVCNDGFVRLNDDASGRCVPEHKCPNKCKDPNAIYKQCPNPCPLTCDSPFPRICTRMCLANGCECAPGFLQDSNGKCIRPKDCPKPISCPKHSRYVMDDNQCPKTCGNRCLPNSDAAGACAPYTGCVCKPGYVRKYDNATGPCIKETKCLPIPTECGVNEVATSCAVVCPPQTCDSMLARYNCLPTECKPGCDCVNGHLRNDSGVCIKSENCFNEPIECNGPNEIYSDCVYSCPPQSCESLFVDYLCAAEPICGPGCRCLDKHFRNSLGQCVTIEECYNDPAGCGGDLNATRARDCGNPNPPTCENPEPEVNNNVCVINGCQCKQEYIMGDNGKCIAPSDCPGGSPKCGENKTYVGCKFGCPTNYCPRDDSRAQVACSMPFPCQGGCACKAGYLIVSPEDPRCVLASECPEVECTRPNEVWDPKPSGCFLERCEDRGSKCDYPYPSGPRCVCAEGHHRTEDDVCVPDSECPPLACKGDYNATLTVCPNPCPKTCDDPEAGDGGCIEICLETDCQCNDGYFLTKIGGICIKPEDCGSCKGDPHAYYSNCPSACEPTCEKPDRNRACTRQCMPPGCVCRDGYVLNTRTGKCVKPKSCPVVDEGCNGDLNATYAECPSFCPVTCENPHVEDNVLCPAVCDPSFCVCKKGYILTKKGGICVEPGDCPVPGCNGDPNAEHKECPSACEPTCANPNPAFCTKQCMPPGCVCKKGFVLNEDTGLCVELEKCPVIGCDGDYNAEYSECPSACPPTCTNPNPEFCTKQCMPPGCVCKKGFVLNEDTGLCVELDKCPAPGCNGDTNAEYSECPSACPPTCTNPDPQMCTFQCMPPGCVCKFGFYLNEATGKCVELENCPATTTTTSTTTDSPLHCGGDPYRVYSECPCERTCTDLYHLCDGPCGPPACVCKPEFVWARGKCIRPEDCPADPRCDGDRNATYKQSSSYCQATCKNPDTEGECMDMPMPPGCVCKNGFLRRKTGGKCIRPEDCPGGWPTCRRNETYVFCKVGCPTDYCPVDDSLAMVACDAPYPCPGGCVCQRGHLIASVDDERCILSSECPPVTCTRPNEEWDPYAPGCLHERCDDKDIPCDFQFPGPPRCRCKKGYYRNQDQICVPECQCPKPGCNGDLNATFSDCPSKCPATCCKPDSDRICTADCDEPGCVCNEGFIQSYPGGPCISPYDCKGGSPHCSENMTYTSCKIDCPMKYCPQDENEIMVICDPIWPCPSGCECKQGFLKPNTGENKCILAADCPPIECSRPNEVWDPSPSICNYERCDEMYYECSDPTPGRPKCVCKPGFYRDINGVCIPAEECPVPEPKPTCGYNEVAVPCRQKCPPENCDIAYTSYACTEESKICEPGCNCLPNHLRNGSGICIPNDQCTSQPEPVPKCGYNEVAVPCRQICPPQNCDIAYTDYACTEESKICEPGCNCLPDHLRNGSGICIPNDQCFYPSTPVCGINEIARDCRKICPPQTCQSKYIKFSCIQDLPCESGCDCVPGYLRDENGICIPSEKCPPLPEPEPKPKCGYNEVAVPCRQICPPQNCEIAYTDYACTDEHKVCEPGCNCLPDHLRNGSGICIPNDKCPYPSTPVCGINEIARDCRRICPPQTCLSKYALFRCVADLPCEPGCDCVPNYLRDERGICIRSEKCPAPCQIADECKRTCAEPNPPNCAYNPPQENIDGCDCKDGYILSELGGKCIPIDQCPPEVACRGDPNARPKRCPKPCPSTCESPNQFPCKRMCEAIGCECKSGFMLSNNTETARCILPDKCPGGNPCGKSGRFVDCKTDCKYDYCPVDDSRDLVFCDPPAGDCLSGCICNLNHKRKSRDDPRCIVSSKCPPVNCTRPNEIWNSCPSACLAENCEDIKNQPITCNTLVLNCEPRCICKDNHFRNSKGICVCAEDCPPPGCGGDPNAVYSECPSACEPTCTNQDPQICTAQCLPPGCVCKPGLVLNEDTGKCVDREDCPVPVCEDPHAVYKQCPSACEPTCANPEPEVCTDQCMPPSCVCKEGYVLNEKDGKCVKKCHCPGNSSAQD